MNKSTQPKSLKLKTYKRFSEVIPSSTKLMCIGVHKLQDYMTCNRLYFWKWVLNLMSRRLNLPFLFGSIVHTGFELVAAKKQFGYICKAMHKTSIDEAKGFILNREDTDEKAIQFQIALLLIKTYRKLFKNELDNFETLGTEISFVKRLELCPVDLLGTIDAYGKENKKLKLKELKTAARVNNEYFLRLTFAKQINAYAVGIKELTGKYPTGCTYFVIRKPGIRVKLKESQAQFLKRLEEDLLSRPDFYFIKQNISFGINGIRAVLSDVEWATLDLYNKYELLDEEQLVDPFCWARNDDACFNYGVCKYFTLCKNGSQFKLFLQLYTMRNIRYKLEVQELSDKFSVNTKPKSKMKGTYYDDSGQADEQTQEEEEN